MIEQTADGQVVGGTLAGCRALDVRRFNIYGFTKGEPEPASGDWRRDDIERIDVLAAVAKALDLGFDTILIETRTP